MKKILINVPDLKNKGGVAQYYKNMNLSSEAYIDYFNINNLNKNVFVRLLKTYKEFFLKIKNYNTIVINPSLTFQSFFRDGIFCWLAKLRKKKLIIFWHGWTEPFEERIKRSFYLSYFFKNTFLNADGLIILGNIFHKKLIGLGLNPRLPYYKETMSFPDEWVSRFSINDNLETSKKSFDILFLSRIVKGKGVNVCIDLAVILQKKFPGYPILIHIAGDGDELSKMKTYAQHNGASNVIFYGEVTGEEKFNLFCNMDVFFFPSETEGFPNVVVEALFFGLPVISRPVGAIPEIILQGDNGYLDESKNAIDFVKYFEPLIFDRCKLAKMSEKCHAYAKSRYKLETVRKKTIAFYQNFVNSLQ